jgi:hypothetical protein
MSLEHRPAREGGRSLIKLWPDAGRRLGLSKYWTYQDSSLGQIPTVRMGRLLFVPDPVLSRMITTGEQPRRR